MFSFAEKQTFKQRAFEHVLICDPDGLKDLLSEPNPVGHIDFSYCTPGSNGDTTNEPKRKFLSEISGNSPLQISIATWNSALGDSENVVPYTGIKSTDASAEGIDLYHRICAIIKNVVFAWGKRFKRLLA